MSKTQQKRAAESSFSKRAVISRKAPRDLKSNDSESKEMKKEEDIALTGALEDSFPASDPVSSLHSTKSSKPA